MRLKQERSVIYMYIFVMRRNGTGFKKKRIMRERNAHTTRRRKESYLTNAQRVLIFTIRNFYGSI